MADGGLVAIGVITLLFFIFGPIAVNLGAFGVLCVGMLKTLWGVFARSDSIIDFTIAFIFTVFPFPILAPIFMALAMGVGVLQSGWFYHLFGLDGFIKSSKGTFASVSKQFGNVILMLFGVGLLSSTGYLKAGVLSKGLDVGGLLLIILSVLDIGRKMYSNS